MGRQTDVQLPEEGVAVTEHQVLALDVGGTKIAAGLVDAGGRLGQVVRRPTPHGGCEALWSVIAGLLTDLRDSAGGPIAGVGVASAGPVDLPRGAISPINIEGVRDFPIVSRVAGLTGLPVRLGGDGLCMALGESRFGAARGAAFVLGMVVSTGIGGGLVLDGTPYHGRTGNAGHVGHVVVAPAGDPCTCGGHGCVETIASGPNLARWARANGWQAHDEADAEGLAAAAHEGVQVAKRAFRRGARALAAAIASTAAVCDLELVVIGGGVAGAGTVLFDPLREELDRYARLTFLRGIRVVPALLGADAGLVGAAALARTPDRAAGCG